MDNKTFNAIVEERIEVIKKVLASKATEYARGDRLSNFKTAGRLDDESPERALWGMFKKHIVSVKDLIDDIEAGRPPMPWPVWQEKLTDMVNYPILLEGLIKERLGLIVSKEELCRKQHQEVIDQWKQKLQTTAD